MVDVALEALGAVELIPVSAQEPELSAVWRELMAYHYLGSGPLCDAPRPPTGRKKSLVPSI